MPNEFVHASVGTGLSQAEWEGVATHVANNQAASDMLYFDGANWVRTSGVSWSGSALAIIGGLTVSSGLAVTSSGSFGGNVAFSTGASFAGNITFTSGTITLTGGASAAIKVTESAANDYDVYRAEWAAGSSRYGAFYFNAGSGFWGLRGSNPMGLMPSDVTTSGHAEIGCGVTSTNVIYLALRTTAGNLFYLYASSSALAVQVSSNKP